eukprot:TRINITY_DN11097_c0_g1_i1.p2 TRINITY_DN11097_c0_g1~~TRINITY_DN11097_c0_g1_i1.p2  ORF type:complete len:142 (+),score=35.87 TRINITY_DN11097_c0_g1_i1:35-427(+)
MESQHTFSLADTIKGGDKTIVKVSAKTSPKGEMGQKYLAAGTGLDMRIWENEEPSDPKIASTRDYEVVGYVIKGKAELWLEGQTITLEEGDSWVVPKGAGHAYKIIESFTAVEATHPVSFVKARDQATSN